jgi:hypothetical protein
MKEGLLDPMPPSALKRKALTSAYEVFARAERIELAAAALYRRVAAACAWSPAERGVFETLEREEIQHAARVRLLTAEYRNDSHLFDVARLDLDVLDEAEGAVRLVAAEVEAGHWGRDPEGLKARVVEMEERCGASHADILADCADTRVAWFFGELSREDREHRALLLGLAPCAAPAR